MTDPVARLNEALSDRYVIEGEIGAGGMATVFLAHDLRHDRKVAVKVLRPELAAIMGAERFLSEIKTTANLQHPHILPLFDSGEAHGFLFFVMPYVEGETLRERMEREKQLPVDDAVRIGTAVAGALDYAHRHGVVHRDIKPANILLHDGQPLVSDFGIALAVQQAGGGRLTETGLSLGTPHYMSPEQATADRDPDARSDVYSLGCVIYEMLTGEPPFPGSTAQAVLGKIIAAAPTPPREHRKSIPAHLEAVILKALEKLPADRFETAADFAVALTDPSVGRTLVTQGAQGAASFGRPRTTVRALAASTLLLAILAAWGWLRPTPRTDIEPARYAIDLNHRMRPIGWTTAISRDGSAIGYFGNDGRGEQLFIKDEGRTDGVPVPSGPGTDAWVAFSPDASSIVISDQSSVRTMPRSGGPATVLRTGLQRGAPAWLDDGTIIVPVDSGVVQIPEAGGEETFIPFHGQGLPLVLQGLPDGRGFLMLSVPPAGTGWAWAYDSRNGEFHQLAGDAGHVWFVAPDLVVIPRTPGGRPGLFAGRLDMKTLELAGPLAPLPDPVGWSASASSVADLLVSWNGTLVHGGTPAAGGTPSSELSWVDPDGRRTATDTSWHFQVPATGGLRLSPDGRRVAISITEETGATNIFVKRLAGGPAQKVTFSSSIARRPSWTPDGSAILYVTTDGTKESLWQVRANGVGTPTEVASEDRAIFEGLWSPDGAWLVYRTDDDGAPGSGDILGLRAGTHADAVPLAATSAEETTPTISPDGRWLAYASTESGGRKEIFVRPFPNAQEGRWQVSTGGGTEPAWSGDGSQLFYWHGSDMMAARPAAEGGFEVLENRTLFDARFVPLHNDDGRWYDVAPDGRFLMVTPLGDDTTGPVVLVQHFDEVIRRALRR